ncbi:MAG: hypothetical protein DIZ77_06415 [endosymbiont of Seepiophila jonesi]|uniref:Uncharacterized protein n=1 Tax=endosymbiont of Lamellibrachia luymesi TaxID=2200907 RepID=A0A370DZ46_9GAMM|nr:MAG: hypothetical protein DIZ79_04970 [endosymbiont of Lamellibrachia luymesi]RDH93177.1 MAG: hypothetical protein DIZ77_06415 [endosymbiont of Seepiophila jonesi]
MVRTLIPDDFAVIEQHVQFAGMHRLPDPHEHVLKFVTHQQSTKKQSADWNAEFRKWLVTERGYEKARKVNHEAHQSTHGQSLDPLADALFGPLDAEPGAGVDYQAVGEDAG